MIRFNIAPGPLGPALVEFAAEARLEFAAAAGPFSRVNFSGLVEDFSTEHGLSRLLHCTGFISSVRGRVLVIRRVQEDDGALRRFKQKHRMI